MQHNLKENLLTTVIFLTRDVSNNIATSKHYELLRIFVIRISMSRRLWNYSGSGRDYINDILSKKWQ